MDTNFSCYILEYGVNTRNLYYFLGILFCFPKRFNEYFRQAVIADLKKSVLTVQNISNDLIESLFLHFLKLSEGNSDMGPYTSSYRYTVLSLFLICSISKDSLMLFLSIE